MTCRLCTQDMADSNWAVFEILWYTIFYKVRIYRRRATFLFPFFCRWSNSFKKCCKTLKFNLQLNISVLRSHFIYKNTFHCSFVNPITFKSEKKNQINILNENHSVVYHTNFIYYFIDLFKEYRYSIICEIIEPIWKNSRPFCGSKKRKILITLLWLSVKGIHSIIYIIIQKFDNWLFDEWWMRQIMVLAATPHYTIRTLHTWNETMKTIQIRTLNQWKKKTCVR